MHAYIVKYILCDIWFLIQKLFYIFMRWYDKLDFFHFFQRYILWRLYLRPTTWIVVIYIDSGKVLRWIYEKFVDFNQNMWMRGKNKNSNTKNILRSFPQEILFLISVANIFLALVVDCMTAFSEQRFYVIMTSLLQVKLHTSRLTQCRIHTRMCWVTTSMYFSFTQYFEGW